MPFRIQERRSPLALEVERNREPGTDERRRPDARNLGTSDSKPTTTRDKADTGDEDLASLLASKTGFANVHAAALVDCDGGDADMIVNSTSLGLKPGDALPLALDAVRPDTVIADIIMVPAETKWLFAAQKAGLQVHHGRHMLDYQIDLIGKFIGAL